MYTRKDRMKAVELFIKYVKRVAKTVYELGYPTKVTLVRWYKSYVAEQEDGVFWDQRDSVQKSLSRCLCLLRTAGFSSTGSPRCFCLTQAA